MSYNKSCLGLGSWRSKSQGFANNMCLKVCSLCLTEHIGHRVDIIHMIVPSVCLLWQYLDASQVEILFVWQRPYL